MPQWRWAWCAEIEKFPSAVLAARHPQSINLGDVAADGFADKARCIAAPDVLVFGSPCQSYSVAGKRLGLDDPRGNLALVALGIVARLKPRWFVFENVPGLLSSAGGSDFGIFLRTVDELGYFGAWAGLDAQYFGLAQRRDRLFFVGHSADWRYPAAVLFEPESLCGHSAPRRQAREGFTHPIAPSLTNSGRGVSRGGESRGQDAVIASFGGNESETFIAHALRADGFDASEDGTGRGVPIIPILEAGARTGKSTDDIRAGISIGEPGDPMFTLQGGKQHAIAFSSKDHGADASTEIAPTLRDASHANAGGQLAVALAVALRGREGGATAELSELPSALRASTGGGDKAHVLASSVRRLTPRECERLQGFPDDYTLVAYRGKAAADGPRYKALGNSMAVPVMRWILSRIAQLDGGLPAGRRDLATS